MPVLTALANSNDCSIQQSMKPIYTTISDAQVSSFLWPFMNFAPVSFLGKFRYNLYIISNLKEFRPTIFIVMFLSGNSFLTDTFLYKF